MPERRGIQNPTATLSAVNAMRSTGVSYPAAAQTRRDPPPANSAHRTVALVPEQVGEAERFEDKTRSALHILNEHVAPIGFELGVHFQQHRDPGRIDESQTRAVDEQVSPACQRQFEIGPQLRCSLNIDIAAQAVPVLDHLSPPGSGAGLRSAGMFRTIPIDPIKEYPSNE